MTNSPITYALHASLPDGRLAMIDITDAVNRAHFTGRDADGTPTITNIADALPGDLDATLAHRIMLVTADNPDGNGDMPITVDPEAERWLTVHARRQGDDT